MIQLLFLKDDSNFQYCSFIQKAGSTNIRKFFHIFSYADQGRVMHLK